MFGAILLILFEECLCFEVACKARLQQHLLYAFVAPVPKLKEVLFIQHKDLISNHHKMMNRTEELQILHDELDEARERKSQLQSQWQKIQEEAQLF